MTAHRYWRALVAQNGSGGLAVIAEVGMMIVAGGSTVTTGGTPIEDSHFGGFTPAQAFDGNAATDWATNAGGVGVGYIGYDFGGSPQTIVEFYIQASASFASQCPLQYLFQSSDDNITWTTQWIGIRDTWAAGNLQRFTKPTAAPGAAHQWWGLQLFTVNTNSWFSFAEFEVHATIGGSQVLTGGTARATETAGGNVPANAFDGNLATFWASNSTQSGDGGILLTYGSLAVAKVCAQIALITQAGAVAADVNTFNVIYSDDGFAWGVEFGESGVTWSSGNQTQLFTNPGAVNESGIIAMAFGRIAFNVHGAKAAEFGTAALAFGRIAYHASGFIPGAAGTGLRQFWTFGN